MRNRMNFSKIVAKFVLMPFSTLALATLITLTAAATSPNASACPLFNDTYNCQLTNDTKTIVLATRVDSGVYIYNYNGQDFIADGVTRKRSPTYSVKASCTDTAARIAQTAVNTNISYCPNNQAKKLQIVTRLFPKSYGVLERNSVVAECADGSVVRKSKDIRCNRQ